MKASNLVVESRRHFDTIGSVCTFSRTIDQTTYSDQRVGCRGERVNLYIFSVHIGVTARCKMANLN